MYSGAAIVSAVQAYGMAIIGFFPMKASTTATTA